MPAAKDIVEMRRRADILERYVALENPTSEEVRSLAGQLGLSSDSLFRLASSWRRSQDLRLLQGSGATSTDAKKYVDWQVPLDEVDLSGVDPDRAAETLRRIGVVQQYLAVDKPTALDRAAAATALELRPERFARIVRAWLLHRKGSAIPGAFRPKTRRRRTTAEGLRVRRLAFQIKQELPNVSVEAVYRDLVQRCSALGLKPPALSTLYRWLAGSQPDGKSSTPPASSRK